MRLDKVLGNQTIGDELTRSICLAVACLLASSLAAISDIIPDPFDDPEAGDGATGCVQAHLHNLGVDAGPIDGVWGGATRRAGESFDVQLDTILSDHFRTNSALGFPDTFRQGSLDEWCRFFSRYQEGRLYAVQLEERITHVRFLLAVEGFATEVYLEKTGGVLAVEAPIFYHGDLTPTPPPFYDTTGIWRGWRIGIEEHVIIRPHARDMRHVFTHAEWRFHAAVLDWLRTNFGFTSFTLTGHSGGGNLAISLAQQRDDVSCVVAASSILNMGLIGRDPRRPPSSEIYDPMDYPVPPIPIAIIYDRQDAALVPRGIVPFIDRAHREPNIEVQQVSRIDDITGGTGGLVFVQTDGAHADAHVDTHRWITDARVRVCGNAG